MPDEPLDPTAPPAAPVSPVTAPAEAPLTAGPATSTGLEPHVAAGLAVVFTLVTGIVFLLIEKRNAYVRFWAMQAVVFGVFGLIVSIGFNILGHIFSFSTILAVLLGLFSLLVSLGLFLVWIIMLVKAFSGKEWELPYFGKIARQQLLKFPAS